jgi:TolB-like protein
MNPFISRNPNLNAMLCLLLLFGGAVTGCAGKTQSYVAPQIGIGYVERLAVLPLENKTQEKYAASRLEDILTTAVLRQGYFQVVGKGEVQRFLREEVASASAFSLNTAEGRKLGKDLSVEAYVTGSVDDYTQVHNGPYSYWVVAATFRMVDAKTGTIIWQASGTENGYSSYERLFGLASQDVNRVTYKLIDNLLKTMR